MQVCGVRTAEIVGSRATLMGMLHPVSIFTDPKPQINRHVQQN